MITRLVALARRMSTTGAAPTAPATPAITAVDDETGVRATVTVAGSTAGVTNQIYYRRTSASVWTAGLTRVGDGTKVQTGLVQGAYEFIVQSSNAGVLSVPSNPVQVTVTDGAAHPTLDLMAKIRAALLADATAGLVKYVHYVVDESLLPEETPLPYYYLTDAGTAVAHGPRVEVISIGIGAVQEILQDGPDGPGLIGTGIASPNIRQKGVLQLLQDARAVLDEAALTGYYQGHLIEESVPDVVPIAPQFDERGQIAGVQSMVVRKRATYAYRRFA